MIQKHIYLFKNLINGKKIRLKKENKQRWNVEEGDELYEEIFD